MSQSVCILGLGSNQNTPTKQLKQAVIHLNNLPGTLVKQVASLYLSKPWGVAEQADFVNTAVEIRTQLTPLRLLTEIKKIEYRLMQRQINQRWHSRVIDIDILLFAKKTLNRKQLMIPHPLILQRCFVTLPLLELKPELPAELRKELVQHRISHDCSAQLIKLKTPLTADFLRKTTG